MGVNCLPKTVTRQRRGCDLNPGPSALESSTLTTRLPSHPILETTDSRVILTGYGSGPPVLLWGLYPRACMFCDETALNSHLILLTLKEGSHFTT